jgi:hypothetical protein
MSRKKKSTKDLAQRIDPVYYRHGHPLRRLRLLLGVGLVAGAALWVGASFALPAEGIYVRGTLSLAHATLAEACDRCHAEAFRGVLDATCLACHRAGPHVPAGKTPKDPRCGTCHEEHGGRARLSDVADGHCNTCHAHHRSITSIEDHVQFARSPRDEHLRFSHRDHLAPDLLKGPLACDDCHRPEADARDFEPIRFDEHCARCHTERIHPDVPGDVPHGVQPPRLRDWAAAAFVRAFLENPALAVPPSHPNVAPGRPPGAPPDWTARLAAATEGAVDAMLTPTRGCLLCHDGDKERIVPPEIPSNWMPMARFDHKTHRTEKCESCHRAETVGDAQTVDLPGIANCRRCHGAGAPATCVTCHTYHPPDKGSWR